MDESPAPQPASSALLTVVFTDVVGSAAIRQNLGDRGYAEAIREHHALVRGAVKACSGGEEIETAGDSFLVSFATPSEAVRFCLLAVARLQAWNEGRPAPLRDRFAVHLGEVVVVEGARKELYSTALDACARILGLAGADQILLTRPVFESARQHLPADVPEVGAVAWWVHGRYRCKGIEVPLEVCEVGPAGAERAAPEDSDKATRVDDGAVVTGWRPAQGAVVPGTSLVLERALGAGAVGEAWLARHRSMHDLRVIKFCFDAERARSLRREVALFRILQERVGAHPHIVRLQDVHLENQPYYLVTEYSEGSDLAVWWAGRGSTSSLEDRLELVAQIADGLQAAHEAGVVHRDVKPANILVEDRGGRLNARLLDFGIGQVLSRDLLAGLTQTGLPSTMLVAEGSTGGSGTVMYLAPELITGRPASPRSDVFSLGVVLWQLVVGDLQRALPTDWERSVTDPLLRADLRRCFAGDPAERYVGTGELARDLRALPARRAALEAEEAAREASLRRAVRRGVITTAAVAGAILVGVSGLAVFAFFQAAEAERAKAESQERLVRTHIQAATEHLVADNPTRALPDLAAGLALVEGTPRERDARLRLAAAVSRLPRLIRVLPGRAALSPDGQSLLSYDGSRLEITRLTSGVRVADVDLGPGKDLTGGVWSPDGARVAVSRSGTLEVRRADDLGLVWGPVANAGNRAYFSWEGRLVHGYHGRSGGGGIQSFDAETGAELAPGERLAEAAGTVVSGDAGGSSVRVARSDGESLSLPIPYRRFPLLLDPQGTRLAGGMSLARIGIWDTRTGDLKAVLAGHGRADQFRSMAFAPDGSFLVTGTLDHRAQAWSRDGAPLGPPVTTPEMTQLASAAVGGRYAVTTSGTWVFELQPGVLGERHSLHTAADGTEIVEEGGELLWRRGAEVVARRSSPCGDPGVRYGRFDLSARSVALQCGDNRSFYLTLDGTAELDLALTGGSQWAPTRSRLVVNHGDERVGWDAETGFRPFLGAGTVVGWLGDATVVLNEGGRTVAWDFDTGAERWSLPDVALYGISRLGPSGEDWVGITYAGALRVRQQGSDRLLETGLRRGSVASSLDGRKFALVDLAGAVRVYDAATLLPVGTPLETGQLLDGAGFTADGAHVVTRGSFEDERWVVSAETNELVAFLPAKGGVRAPSIDAAGVASIWDLAVDDRPVADWVDIAALYAAARSTPAGRVPVPIGEVAVLWERLSRVYPEQFQPE